MAPPLTFEGLFLTLSCRNHQARSPGTASKWFRSFGRDFIISLNLHSAVTSTSQTVPRSINLMREVLWSVSQRALHRFLLRRCTVGQQRHPSLPEQPWGALTSASMSASFPVPSQTGTQGHLRVTLRRTPAGAPASLPARKLVTRRKSKSVFWCRSWG